VRGDVDREAGLRFRKQVLVSRNIPDEFEGREDESYPEVTHWELALWPGRLIMGPPEAVLNCLRGQDKQRGFYMAVGHDPYGGLAYGGRSLADLRARLKAAASKPGCTTLLAFIGEEGKPLDRTVVVHTERMAIDDYDLLQVGRPGWNQAAGENHGGDERLARRYYEGVRILLKRTGAEETIRAALTCSITNWVPTGPHKHLCGAGYSAVAYPAQAGFIVTPGARLAVSRANQDDVKSGWEARKRHEAAGRLLLSEEEGVWGVTTQPIIFPWGSNSGTSVAEDFVKGSHRDGRGWKPLPLDGCPKCGKTVYM
jgi:hypothetical protein